MLKKHVIATVLISSLFMWTSSALAAEVTVQKGDTLWSLARKHDTTVSNLKAANNLKSDNLKIGQILQLPSVEAKTTTPSPEAEADESLASRGGQTRIDSLLKFASSFLGAKYKYGGESPKGFDCSGFVRYVFKQFGIDLVHSSASQFSTLKQKVEKADLLPGDLVYFNTSGKRISHVGIYMGESKFIHASTPKGGVKISSMAESYYSSRYKGARRVVLTKE